ncbi:MAG: hypothetical protein JW963_08835 [Anaerolineales bacterium]|nr:hypothetical protein [Anaerolineales bacterium]
MRIPRIIPRNAVLIIMLVTLASMTLACSGSSEPSQPERGVEQVVPTTMKTMTPKPGPTLTPLPTFTPAPPTEIPPTTASTSLPPPAPGLPAATRINFARGTTYGTATGTIQGGQTLHYVLKAQLGQPMLASVSSPNNDVTMSIIAENGATLLMASQASTNWQGTLPATQDYYFQLFGGANAEDFSLWVSIPSRVQFDRGAISATVGGATVDGYIASYVVAAQGGQNMNIVLMPNPNVAALTIWGFSDGQPYMRAQMGSTTFNMQLPSTQDYIINVVPQGGQEVDFTMTIEIR